MARDIQPDEVQPLLAPFTDEWTLKGDIVDAVDLDLKEQTIYNKLNALENIGLVESKVYMFDTRCSVCRITKYGTGAKNGEVAPEIVSDETETPPEQQNA